MEVVSRMVGAVVVGGVMVVLTLVAFGSGREGTVVAKSGPAYDYACGAAGNVVGPMGVPSWGSCSTPNCWRLVIRDSAGNVAEPCVNRESYDATELGTFWHNPDR